MPKPSPQDQEPEIFLTDLSTLNQLYSSTKAFLKIPSLTMRMNLQDAIAVAERMFFLQQEYQFFQRQAGSRRSRSRKRSLR